MNYTNEQYEEDRKIAEYVYRDHFRKHRGLKEDMMQNALLALWQSRKDFNEKSSYRTYANKIAFNAMLRTLEKEQKHIYNDISIFDEIKDDLQIMDTLVSELDGECVEKIEEMKYLILSDRVESVKSGYDKKRRKIIEMYLNRRSFDEIAHCNNVSKGYVCNQVKLFRHTMEICLGRRSEAA